MLSRATLFCIILFSCLCTIGQVNDDFSDGDFSSNPVWSGDDIQWIIDGNQLRSNNSGADTYYLSTPSSAALLTSWEFFINLTFGTSGVNFVDVYLISDQPDLLNVQNGYFVRIGRTSDDITFHKVVLGVETLLIDGQDGIVNSSSNNPLRLKISRDGLNKWTLLFDDGDTGTFAKAGTVNDSDISTSAHFGISITQSSAASPVNGHFFDDFKTNQLEIDSVIINSSTEIEVYFDQNIVQADAETAGNYSITGVNITSASQSTLSDSIVTLTLDGATPLMTQNYELSVNSGLTKNDAATYDFNYTDLDLESLLTTSSKEIKLLFNDQLDENAAETLTEYTIDNGIGQPNSASLQTDLKSVVLGFTNELSEGINYQLTVDNVSNKKGNSTFSGAENFTFVVPLIANSVVVVDRQTIQITFNKALSEAEAETIGNYSVDGSIGNPTNAGLSDDNKNVHLNFDQVFGDETYNLTISNLEDLNGNVISGTPLSFTYLNLTVNSIVQSGENGIQITFNQEVNETSAELANNYSLTEFDSPTSAARSDSDDKVVVLTWDNLYNSAYTLTISDVNNDLENSTISDSDLSISISKSSSFRDLIINEIMADPLPSEGLPEAEYVEIYNPNDYSLNVKDFTLNSKTIDSIIITAKSYLLLTSPTDSASFGLTNASGVTGFDPLTNTGETIVLADQFGNKLDTVAYELSWYRDEDLDNGGHSLELIDPLQPCSGVGNWNASTATKGGTPGIQNSVFNDVDDTSPTLVNFQIIGDDSLKLTFSEPLGSSSINISALSFDGYTIGSLTAQSLSEYLAVLTTDLVSERSYDLTITNVADCRGNVTISQTKNFYHDTKPPVLEQLVILSDQEFALLFDEPLNKSRAETESNFTIDGLTVDRAVLQDSAMNRIHIFVAESFSLNQEYQIGIFGLRDTLANEIIQIDQTFTFNSDIDTAKVIAPNLLEIIFVKVPNSASLKVSNFLLDDEDFNPREVIRSASNQRSVRLAFAKNFAENRELKIYLSNITAEADANLMITPAYTFQYDTRAPNIEALLVKSDSQLVVMWNEPMNTQSATISGFYTLENGEQPISIIGHSSSVFELTFADKFPIEEEKILSSKGVKDLSGNIVTTTRREEFTYDPRAPIIEGIDKISEDEIRIVFNEPITLASAIDLNNFFFESTAPIASRLVGPDSTTIVLEFGTISELEEAGIQVSDIDDRFGNRTDTITTTINTRQPKLVGLSAQTDTTLQVAFSHAMSASAFELDNYQLEDLSILRVEGINDFKAKLTLSESLIYGDSLVLTVSSLSGQNGFELVVGQFKTVFNSLFIESHIIDNRAILLVFDTEFSSVSKSQFSISDNSVELALVDGEEKGQLRIGLAQPLVENTPVGLSWIGLEDRFGRELPDYHTIIDLDTQKPQVESLENDFFGQIIVEFSEPMDASIASLNKYRLIELGNAKTVTGLSDSTVVLDFGNQLISGSNYQLIVNSLSDQAGNYSDTDTISFVYQQPLIPSLGDIIITELLPDPSPSIGLPEVEYIELYNRADQTFDLRALSIGDESRRASLPSYNLAPNSYVILVASGRESLFGSTNVLGVSGLLTLSNSADQVILFNILDEQIDEVNYSIDWYGDDNKDDGGYSLELIDPKGECPVDYNWRASESESGGTPGTQNSVFNTGADGILPIIQQFQFTSDQIIQVVFNDPMDSSSMVGAAVEIPGLTITSLTVASENGTVLNINLQNPAPRGVLFSISISGARDCAGDVMLPVTFELGIGKVPEVGELIITEIMADPDPAVGLPISEYIEIYNSTDQLLDMGSVFFRDATSSRQLSSVQMVGNSYLILCPSTQVSSFEMLGKTLGLSNWPSLTNSGEELSMRIGDDVIERVVYSDDWYGNTDKSDGGYSLELINPFSNCPGSANWKASESEIGGTPGSQNSIFNLNPDSDAPILLTSEALDQLTLKFVFNEAMDSTSLVNAEIGGAVSAGREVFGIDYKELRIILSNSLPKGETITLTLSGASDCSGNVMNPTSFMVGFGDTPAFNELLITEIMSDPDPVFGLPNSEYLELYNASDRLLTLDGLELIDATDTSSLPSVVIPSGDYLLLLPTSSVASFPFIDNKIGLSGWLSLANGGERLSIRNDEDLIFTIEYEDEWYGESGSDGGYSLEMRDVTNPCAGAINWGINIGAEGGTPGYLNSNTQSVPDNFGPNLLSAIMLTNQSVQLTFDEPIAYDFGSLVSVSFEPELSIVASLTDTDRTLYSLVFETELPVNTPHVVTISDLGDCLNNPIRKNNATFVRPDEPDSLDLVINEVLFNPRTNGVDFVELYNRSEKYLDLNDWNLGRQVEEELQTSLITQPYMLAPSAYVAITSDTLILRSEYPQGVQNAFMENRLPTMANNQGSVILIDDNDRVIDRFDYFDDFHLGLLQSIDGVSLERISSDATTQDGNNWTSASAAVGFATPGYTNSQSYEAPISNAVVSIEPKIFVPESINPAFQSFTTINYSLDKSGQFANVTVYNQSGLPVAELARGTSLSTSGFIRWDGITNSGSRARMGYYVVLFEIFDSNGNQQLLKETVVIGR